MITKGAIREIEDGREDAIIFVSGERFITIHQEGYIKMGMTYEQAKEFVISLVDLFVAAGKAPASPDTAAKEGGNG